MRVLKTSFRGNPAVGLYIYVTDEYCLAGPEVPDHDFLELERVFGVKAHRFTIAGTGLLGVFLAGNDTLLVPGITFERELKILEKLGIKYAIIETIHTALGNNILCNSKGCLVSEEYSEADRQQISAALGLEVKPFKIRDIMVVGSCAVATERGCVCHKGVQDFEKDMIEQNLKVPVITGTVNMGNPYIKAGLAANSRGMLIGDTSGGPEIVNAEEAFRE
jgi:translation initiation factor 6